MPRQPFPFPQPSALVKTPSNAFYSSSRIDRRKKRKKKIREKEKKPRSSGYLLIPYCAISSADSRSRGGKRGGKKNRDKSRGGAIEPGASFRRACRLCLNGGVLVAMVTFMGEGEALCDLEAGACANAKIERDAFPRRSGGRRQTEREGEDIWTRETHRKPVVIIICHHGWKTKFRASNAPLSFSPTSVVLPPMAFFIVQTRFFPSLPVSPSSLFLPLVLSRRLKVALKRTDSFYVWREVFSFFSFSTFDEKARGWDFVSKKKERRKIVDLLDWPIIISFSRRNESLS